MKKNLNALSAIRVGWFSTNGREQQIKDYIRLTNKLIWQRQASFLAAAILAAFYFDPIPTFVCYGAVVMTEILDLVLGRRAKTWDGQDPVVGGRILKTITINTIVSAMAISIFIINIAIQQTSGSHFTPLFFLFSASLFAAMYNSQMIGILILRLAIYALAFIYIASIDLIRSFPPLSSQIWLEFFTTVFVLYFISDMSIKFYVNYHKNLEQMDLIKKENERTKAAYEVKSQFLATVSHELRTPLTSIKASLDLANNGMLGELSATLKPAIGIAARNAQRLAALIDDLLDLQKIEAGEMNFEFKTINANELVKEAAEATAGFAEKLGIGVTIVPCPEDCFIMGDRGRLIQVMNNLLSNALKFSKEDGVVKLRVETVGSRVRISVHDEGVGIPKDAKDRLFGKFSQVDSSDVRKVGGTGLGLHISKQIIVRHNAMIDYTSELGVGTTFYLEFDQAPGQANEGVDLEDPAKAA